MFMTLRTTHVLATAIALATSGVAMANTNLDGTSTGDVFINVVDTTNNTSFLFDTGFSQASFNVNQSQIFTFSGDANYATFVAGEGSGDVLTYSVISATNNGATTTGTMLFTSNAGPSAVLGNALGNALTYVQGFASNANGVTSTTTNSALLSSATTWGQQAYEYNVDAQLGIAYTSPGSGVGAIVGAGDTLNFYDETSTHTLSANKYSTLSTLAGTWTYAAGIATYNVPSAVPLPTPVLLLLSGLGLMGVVARRNKSEA
jgi:hypothetical protein